MAPLVRFAAGVTLIGGGVVSRSDLDEALALAPVLVAADGGADAALAFGHSPIAVIGDFDSLSDAARAALPADVLHHVAEQDSTDFQKCLERIGAAFVLAVGFDGRRLDHTLATLNVMARWRGAPLVLLTDEDVVFLAPPALSLNLLAGARVSLFPMGPCRGRSVGLEWPIDGIEFTPDGRSGTSNRALGPVVLEIEGPMLVMLERGALPVALAGLGLRV